MTRCSCGHRATLHSHRWKGGGCNAGSCACTSDLDTVESGGLSHDCSYHATTDRCWRVLEAMERAAAHCTEADGDYGEACERYARLLRAALEDKLA